MGSEIVSQPVKALRSRGRTVGVYALALSAGLIAAWAAHEHIQQREQELVNQTSTEMRTRLVAAVDLRAGSRLQVDDLAVRDIPLPWVPGASFDPNDVDHVVGGILTADLTRGDILLDMHVKTYTDPPLSDLVPSGRRAVTLPAGEIHAVSGLLQEDDLIDLYVSFTHQGQHLTAPLVQGLRVLAIGGQPDMPKSITFDASEQDAIKLVAARHTGSLTAMLRHRGDARVSESVAPRDLAAFMGLEPPTVSEHVPVSILYGDRVDTDTSLSESPASEFPLVSSVPAAIDRTATSIRAPSTFQESR